MRTNFCDFEKTVEKILALNPESVTVHTLCVKRGAYLAEKYDYFNTSAKETAKMLDFASQTLIKNNKNPYYMYRQKNMAGNFENVGYAAPGKACIYNILIMEEKQTIVACGAGTTTKVTFPAENRLERAENVKDVASYIERIDEMIERKEKLLSKLV